MIDAHDALTTSAPDLLGTPALPRSDGPLHRALTTSARTPHADRIPILLTPARWQLVYRLALEGLQHRTLRDRTDLPTYKTATLALEQELRARGVVA